ncbi:nucleotidyltransferase family protein [Chitinophaga parva]|uniref:nucleotidyltransferase family protein n=1 Tax=Chitinophaga parva TaxID=2169414 RepID=UPI00196A4A12|nr:nucleotidyltransferase family protein [Chitinophaga parva]
MVRECMILAGGFGTRLRSVVADKPKCLAPMGNHPFLYYLFQYLHAQGFEHAVLSLGYLSEQVIAWCNDNPLPLRVSFAVEQEPLGTGGAILHAMPYLADDTFAVFNGDTFFDVAMADMLAFAQQHNSKLTLALKPMEKFDRYGSIALNGEGRITAFREKQYQEKGLINGGVYLASQEYLKSLALPTAFSFEKTVLEPQATAGGLLGFISDTYFIDIGIPEDFTKAGIDLVKMYQ